MRSLTKSNVHFRKAKDKLPLGVSTSKRYWGETETIYIARGKGARVRDIDDNEYIDYRLAAGAVILGYADARVDAAAIEGMQAGGIFALSTELEYELACRISEMVPAAELVSLAVSGTEAVMAALRVARAYTGKDAHVVIEGSNHGMFNEVMWQTELEDWKPENGAPRVASHGYGVPAITRRLSYSVPLNDTNAIEDLFRRRHHKIGAFLIEPIMGNCCAITANPQYLKDVRELCDRYNIVFIIDEAKTGFRVARGGVQELFGIAADLCTFAKSMGNGYPIAALGGREDIMRHIGRGVEHGGTYTGHTVSLAAANRTLDILNSTDVLTDVKRYGMRLQSGMTRILRARSIPHSFTGHPSLMGLFLANLPPDEYRGWLGSDYKFYNALMRQLHEQGILVEPDSREPWLISAAHDLECLDETLEKFERALDITLEQAASKQHLA